METPEVTPYTFIKSERKRQIEKGFDVAHDDTHINGELAAAAAAYAQVGCYDLYPFDNPDKFKENQETMTRVQQLVVAGAFIVAEIERLMRSGLEIDIEIDIETGDVLFSRDNTEILDAVKAINPDDDGTLECFIKDKPETIDGKKNYKSFCG